MIANLEKSPTSFFQKWVSNFSNWQAKNESFCQASP